MCLFATEWHQDDTALSWLDALLDKECRGGIAEIDLSTHIRARELVDLMRAQMGSRKWDLLIQVQRLNKLKQL